METKEKFAEFSLEPELYMDLFVNKDYLLPAAPLAMIKANAPVDQKRRFKKLLKNQAGIYGWLHVQQSLCYVGSSVRLHVRPWQHVSGRGSTNKNFKLLWNKESLDSFILVIFEIVGSSEEVTVALMESTENLYLQHYVPQDLLLNVLLFAYTNLGYRHSDEMKKAFSLSRKGKKGHQRPDLTGPLHPMYGRTQEQNPFFGQKHSVQSLQMISEAAKKKTGFKSSRGCPVKLQNGKDGQVKVFATKTEAATFLKVRKAYTVTRYIQKAIPIQDTWLCFAMTKEDYTKHRSA
jgi:group I intron endonuclease